MNWKFWKKRNEYKRPNYYPSLKMKYSIREDEDEDYIDSDVKFNYCCKKMKKGLETDKFWSLRGTRNLDLRKERPDNKLFLFLNGNYGFAELSMPIWYCPFCGAKLEIECVGRIRKVKVGCDEVVEPEKVIPATTKKVCKYEWQEVKN